MARQDAEATGSASLVQAGGDVAQTVVNIGSINIGIDQLLESNSPKARPELPAPIAAAVDASGQHFLRQLFEMIGAYRPDLVKEFASPAMLSATNRAQTDFYESENDEELADALTKLLIELASSGDSKRGIKGQSLRLALRILPSLTTEHTNALAVVSILKYLHVANPQSPEQVVREVWNSLLPFHGRIPTSPMEYRYIESTGAASHGVISDSLAGQLMRTYRHELQHFLPTESLQPLVPQEISNFLEKSELEPTLSRVTESGLQLFEKTHDFSLRMKLKKIIDQTEYSETDFRTLVDKLDPRFNEVINILDSTDAMRMEVNAAGYAIAFLAWNANDPKAMSLDEFLGL